MANALLYPYDTESVRGVETFFILENFNEI